MHHQWQHGLRPRVHRPGRLAHDRSDRRVGRLQPAGLRRPAAGPAHDRDLDGQGRDRGQSLPDRTGLCLRRLRGNLPRRPGLVGPARPRLDDRQRRDRPGPVRRPGGRAGSGADLGLQFIGQAADGSGDLEYFSGDGTTAGHTFSLGPVFDLAADGILGPPWPWAACCPSSPEPGRSPPTSTMA